MKIKELEFIASLGDDYEYDNMSSDEGMWFLEVYKCPQAPYGTIAIYSDENMQRSVATIEYTFDDVSKLLPVMREMKEKDDYHDVQFPFEDHGIDLYNDFEWDLMPARCKKGRHVIFEEVDEVTIEELEKITKESEKVNSPVENKEEAKMNKNTRFVIAVVIGSACNVKQIKQFQEWVARVNVNTDLVVCGDPIRTRKLGKVIADMKLPARVIGCNVENSEDAFLYTHRDAHPCKWAIDHADTVITIGDGSIVSKAKKYAFETNRSCYNYGRLLSQSICKNHYEKAVITRADIVTTNEAKAEAVVTKPVVKEAADPMVAAKKELEAAKREFEAAKAKLDAAQAKVDALAKPVEEKKEEVVEGRGKELFVDTELSTDMATVTQNAQQEYKSIAQEVEEELAAPVDTTGDVINFRGQTYEVMVDDFEPLDTEDVEKAIKNGDIRPVGKSHNDMAKMVNAIADAKPAADFTFEGKGYNVVVKEAFDIELFNSCDAETKKAVIEDSMAAGHIVAA